MLINKPFKNSVRELSKKHIEKNLETYVGRTLSVVKRPILTTKRVADAHEKIKRAFLQCGLCNNL